MDTSETAPSFAAPVAGGFVGVAPKLGAVVCGGEAGARGGGGGGGTRDGGGGGEGAAGARGGGGEGRVGEGVGALAIRDVGATAIAFDLAGRVRGRCSCAYSLAHRWRSLRCSAVSLSRASCLRFRSFSLCASRFAGFCPCFIRYLPCHAVFTRLCASSSASLCKSAALEDAVALEGALVALLEDGIVDQYAGFSIAEESEREERRGATATVGDNRA